MAKKKMPQDVYDTVMGRAGGACEAMIHGACTGHVAHWHHRKISGREHTIPNGLAVCDACHRWIHAHPARSYSHGWLVKMNADPGETPVTYRGQPVYLTADGRTEHYFKPRNDAGLSS